MSAVGEITERLMRDCLDDAERIIRDRWGSPPNREAVVTMAVALFEARWRAGYTRLYQAVMTGYEQEEAQ